MKRPVVSAEAQSDIDLIAAYTNDTWGWQQADRYLSKLEDSFQLLAENLRMGRSCDAISAGLLRHEAGKHVIFYRLKPGGVRVVRLLHQQMTPSRRTLRNDGLSSSSAQSAVMASSGAPPATVNPLRRIAQKEKSYKVNLPL